MASATFAVKGLVSTAAGYARNVRKYFALTTLEELKSGGRAC